MKLVNKGIIVFVLSLFSFGAFAANLKIGVINPQKLFMESPQAKKADKILEKEFKARSEKVSKLRDDLSKKDEIYKKDRAALTQKARIEQEKELNRLRQDFQRQAGELEVDYKVKRNELLADFDKDFKAIVNEIAKKEKFDLILPNQIIIYGASNIDITEKVLNVFKKKFK